MLMEQAAEIGGVVIPYRLRNLLDIIVGILHQVHGVGDTQRNDVLHWRGAGELLEFLPKPIGRHTVALCVIVDRNGLSPMTLKPAHRLHDLALNRSLFVGGVDEMPMHQQKQMAEVL